ncbi:hypothetical protein [Sphingomonas psychrotolerans]|uniref:Uncharacterized protein n=1 Tax=Sphingomonas psychrotolerans TaxID=1327635 RepID=A0A2K8MIT4_9SPHN|nr:hypothetical protein [Sphingomonas psychrotolerans]ATY33773.1 hypothetical protein CVN68_18905 [Sphingomonas psychrotolerans]
MILASSYFAAFATWLVLGVALVLVRQGLIWVALTRLKPAISRRIQLPEGHRISEPMRLGIAYTVATWGGRLGVGYLIAPPFHLVLVGFDSGWTVQIGIVLTGVLGIAAAVFALDRGMASWVRNAANLPADWRTRAV